MSRSQVFELGGDVVEPALADNLMRLIAEGAGEDDATSDAELRGQAVSSYLALLNKPQLPDVLLQVPPPLLQAPAESPCPTFSCHMHI